MCKKMVLFLISVCIVFVGVFCCFHKDNIIIRWWRALDNQLDYERSLEVGDDFNKISWGDLTFQINHHKDGNNLEYVSVENNDKHILMKNVSSYRISKGCLYVKSLHGCAIIDENDFCRIYYDSDAYEMYNSQMLKTERIEYISEYNEFNEEEQKFFEKMPN